MRHDAVDHLVGMSFLTVLFKSGLVLERVVAPRAVDLGLDLPFALAVRVRQLVLLQGVLASKALVACGARKLLFARVGPHVSSERR